MSNLAIRIDGIGKRYRIGTLEERPDTLVGAALGALKAPLKSFRELRKLSTFSDADEADVLWALRDISFDVRHGEVVGLIGRNGAGKSTLLKVLSRITEPTTGRIDLYGRVASLLEVGTGFHPDLTGRENAYLNGTILGMTKAEVDRKFDEIVAFSEIEQFIDTPVKRYSSGMYVRLGFSVAINIEPDVLLVEDPWWPALISVEGKDYTLPEIGNDAFSSRVLDILTNIKYGKEEDRFGWIVKY